MNESKISSASSIEEITGYISTVCELARINGVEGSATMTQLKHYSELVKQNHLINIGEIGFNSGYSTVAFLKGNPECKVTSFDLGTSPYVKIAKVIIDSIFPGRHTLIIGDSAKTIPEYHVIDKFDMFLIDGCHTFAGAYTDLKNVRHVTKKNALIIIDDIAPWFPWGIEVSLAYFDYQNRYNIKQLERYTDYSDKLTVFSDMPEGVICLRSWILFLY